MVLLEVTTVDVGTNPKDIKYGKIYINPREIVQKQHIDMSGFGIFSPCERIIMSNGEYYIILENRRLMTIGKQILHD